MIRIVLIAVLVFSAAPVVAKNYYGAIAYSSQPQHWGRSWNRKSEIIAKKRALLECKKSGGKNCKTVVWVTNSCGAFAVSKGSPSFAHSGFSYGLRNHKAARSRAVKECNKSVGSNDCKIVTSTCNFGN